ncbi:hypothetical protein [uncultured Tateyamaria sp.]|uniref:hypothetical protein n=1 Tax=uncultured Tateyamaria sp. TaxID=455651 RepID=UPI00260EDD74|nr:hypothetical protein [uncultured Tateyamaria sp.]
MFIVSKITPSDGATGFDTFELDDMDNARFWPVSDIVTRRMECSWYIDLVAEIASARKRPLAKVGFALRPVSSNSAPISRKQGTSVSAARVVASLQ